jgi:hypothetical protein
MIDFSFEKLENFPFDPIDFSCVDDGDNTNYYILNNSDKFTFSSCFGLFTVIDTEKSRLLML